MTPPPPAAPGEPPFPADGSLAATPQLGGTVDGVTPVAPPVAPGASGGPGDGTRPPTVVRKRRRSRRRVTVEWMIVLVVAALVALGLRAFVVQAFFVPSGSMEPTLAVGDRILVVKPGWLAGPITRGSIIVFRHPPNIPCQVEAGVADLVKRVIGLPGETIWSGGPGDNTIFVNGKALSEPGWFAPGPQVGEKAIARTKIPTGDYFVMGDNRAYSCDSRYFGPIPSSSIVGKVVLDVWRNNHPYFHIF
jgi:signal peptidase I